ncbi:response regulator transcription factor [Salisediminibacterium selenitireducens]|uniref:Transcriptional regulator, LuxR family n=1 Tax=Bacillus selenitireducens (strain ATCC 700615 / DSM 15326 / MLS10) TaxID=439292 RepID=D6Y0G1_BACIE|nr:LuxR C-terminal-related transcriptional regulator [Salisediminibacterium selenitireducens]ADH98552.1 transcriptional regulator, LuxR family [[Bacillus] selenitireducens MLS10]
MQRTTYHPTTPSKVLFIDRHEHLSREARTRIERTQMSRDIVIDKELPDELSDDTVVFLVLGDYSLESLDEADTLIEKISDKGIHVLLLTIQRPSPSLFPYFNKGLSGMLSKRELFDYYPFVFIGLEKEGVYLEQDLHMDLVEVLYRKKLRHQPIRRLVFRSDDIDVHLTKNEKQVLQLVLDGHNNRKIAELMFLAPSTVSTTISHLLKKLGANDRTDAMVQLIKRGWVDAVR